VSATQSVEDYSSDKVVEIVDVGEQRRIKTKLKAAVLAFRAKLILPPVTGTNMELCRQVNDVVVHTRETMDATYDEVLRTQETVANAHREVLQTRELVEQLVIRQQHVDAREEREALAREQEIVRDGLVFSGTYFSLVLLGRQDIAGVLQARLRAECLRQGVPSTTVAAFHEDKSEKLDLLRPYLPRQVLVILNYFRHQLGGPRVFPQQESDALEAHLATFDYPLTLARVPTENLRLECLHRLYRFAYCH
jgi:hypothetical protein